MFVFGMACAHAAHVDEHKALQIATNLMKMEGAGNVGLVNISSSMPYTEFYTFVGADGKGFVLVSGDDCVVPIIGYSTTERFSVQGMPDNIRSWLAVCDEQIRFYRSLPDGIPTEDRSAERAGLRARWDALYNGMRPDPPLNTAVLPLLSTRWDQSPYYNNLCPYNSSYGQRTVAGCVATATAQIMKYWNHPATGYGSHSYIHTTYGSQSANFGTTTYAWSSMPDSLSSSSTSAQINAVATLMYHVGVAVEMDYGLASDGGSMAFNYNETGNAPTYGSASVACAENALRYYFKYRSSIHHVSYSDYSQSQWITILRHELDNNRPMLYSGFDADGGHSFVCDGYNNSGLFHFNWGWGGYCDGYYAVGSLNPSAGGTGGNTTYTFNLKNTIVIGIQPNLDFGGTTTVNVSNSTASTGSGTITGGGTYTGTNGTLVTITATAAEGSRFTGWSDGYKYSPRTFYANGGTYTFLANFVQMAGDTLGYCSDRCLTNYQAYTNPTMWGIKIPATRLTAGHNLSKVMMYIKTAGSYTLKVYTGTTSATTLAHTQSFTAPASLEDQWCILTLSNQVVVDGTKSLWIMLQSSEAYPAAVTYYAGNNDSRVWGSSFATFSENFSFMIRGVFAPGATPPPTYGDTVSYCDTASFANTIGFNSNPSIDWGIKLPPSMVSHRNYVTDVMLYVAYPGSYRLNVYRGATTTSSTLVSSRAVRFDGSAAGTWQTIHLLAPVATNTTQPVWVTFHSDTIPYPVSACAYSGDSNSSYLSADGGASWVSLDAASGGSLSYSWMIKAILSNTASPSVAIDGDNVVGVGTTARFVAMGPASTTYIWSFPGAVPSSASGDTATTTWNTPGTYNVILTGNHGGTLLRDTLPVTVVSCNVTGFPYTMGFENSESTMCWNSVDNDGDGYGWKKASEVFSGSVAHGGSDCMVSASYINGVGALTPDNWLVSPCLNLTAGNNYTLTWYDAGTDSAYYAEHYAVYVSTTGGSISNFSSSPVFSTTLTGTSYTQRTVSLNAYAGQNIYIAFRHFGTTDQYWLRLDDICVTETVPTTNYTVTVLSNDPAMGSVAGGGTYASGTVTTITATANSGYHFVQWNDGNTNAVRSITVTANVTYTAYFAANPPDTYTVTVLSNDPAMGSVTGGGTYASGTVTTIAATANSGYHFVQWNDGNTDAVRSITVTANVTYTAYFAANPPDTYTVTVLSNDPAMGSVTGGGTYASGTVTTITATANSGYHFVQWNDGNTNAIRAITVTGDVTYTAYFTSDEVQYYTITVLSGNSTMGMVEGGGTFPSGTVTAIVATPFPGYRFLQWNDGVVDNPRSIVVTSDATYLAHFIDDQGIDEVSDAIDIELLPGYCVSLDGVAGRMVGIYDMMGRRLESMRCDNQRQVFTLPAAGVYMIAVEGSPAQRVVVVK